MDRFSVESIPQAEGREYIINRHYTAGCAVGSMMWGLYDNVDQLRGVIAFHTPISENVRKAFFDGEKDQCWCSHIDEEHGFHQHVTELHRLATDEFLPSETTSWFVSQSLDKLKKYKPKYWAVLSHADSTEGHLGTIYQACNATYTGTTDSSKKFYRKSDGTLKPPRNGIEGNISPEEARERGWEVEERGHKHRYIFFLPDGRRHKRWIENHLKYEEKEYPQMAVASD